MHSTAKFMFLAFKLWSRSEYFLNIFLCRLIINISVCVCVRVHAVVEGYSADVNQYVLMYKKICLYTPF